MYQIKSYDSWIYLKNISLKTFVVLTTETKPDRELTKFLRGKALQSYEVL